MGAHCIVRVLIVTACAAFAASAAAQPATTPYAPGSLRAQSKSPVAPQGYSVVLVLGDIQPSASSDNVPAAARKALNDMKEFLPYKGYRLLDAQWILGSQRSSLRLRGADDSEYQLILRGTPMAGRMHVVFQLQEPAAADAAREAVDANARYGQLAAARDRLQAVETVRRERERAHDTAAELAPLVEEIERLKQQVAALEGSTPVRGRAIIDTSFSMDIGETVVVGTSRVKGGDKALIALLTAVAKANGK